MATRLSLCSAPMNVMSLSRGPKLNRLGMICSSSPISVDLQIRSHTYKNKVFEDRSAGIVCYRDENGEITCEGYDEGPRFHYRYSYNTRDVKVIEILERCWLQAADGNNAEKEFL